MLAFTIASTAAFAASTSVPSSEYKSTAMAAPWAASTRRCTTVLYWAALQPGPPTSPTRTWFRRRRQTSFRAEAWQEMLRVCPPDSQAR